MNWNVIALLLVAILAANLPFASNRLAGVIRLAKPKHAGWQLLEFLLLYVLVGGFALLLESRSSPVHPQNWQFYVTTFALFLVAAFPGFVLRHFWHRRAR